MIRKETWLLAIESIRTDAAMYLSNTCDKNAVSAVLDDLENKQPPKVKHNFGIPLELAKKSVIESLYVELTSHSIQRWLDDAYIELTSASYDE